jgi:hypothetical protein
MKMIESKTKQTQATLWRTRYSQPYDKSTVMRLPATADVVVTVLFRPSPSSPTTIVSVVVVGTRNSEGSRDLENFDKFSPKRWGVS